jgi:type I restriction enzyme M protein
MSSSAIVQKLWNYCNVLRDDGMSYLLARGAQASGDYPSASLRIGSEQLTYLLFLFTCALFAGRKMADERTRRLSRGIL